MGRRVNFNPKVEISYIPPSRDTTSCDSSEDSSTLYRLPQNPSAALYPTNTVFSLSSPSLLINSSCMHADINGAGHYSQDVPSSLHSSVTEYGVTQSTGSELAPIEHSSTGFELTEDHPKYYDYTGLHIALSSNLNLLDYDISMHPENDNSIAETEAVSPYLDKPATRDHSKEVGIQHPALPVIIWIRVASGFITVSDILHGMYNFMMRPSPDKLLESETTTRQVYIKRVMFTRTGTKSDEDRTIRWIDWMPINRRIVGLAQSPEGRRNIWMIVLEDDPENHNNPFTSRL
ncbi:hypothetical protein J132_06635 [Termitomyces sp. J132]|nr:hypothetical protein J132_06635 [Termitomyces sp. J132]